MDGLRVRREGDAGFTLIEMLVVVMLLGVVGSLITSIMITSMRTARWQEEKSRSLVAAKTAMERVTREVRGANSMVTATPRALTLVTKQGTVRRQVTLAVVEQDGNVELTQTVERDDLATAEAGTLTTTVVLGGLAVGQSEAVFTYADGSGTPLTPLPAVNPQDPVTYNPAAVNTVGIRIVIRRGSSSETTELYQLVSIRNLEN